MAWDSKTAAHRRQRSTSNSTSKSTVAQAHDVASIEPKSTHVADPLLQPFISPSFDPAAFLNATLPSLQTSVSPRASSAAADAVPLAELSNQTQALLSQLSAHTTRLTATLTQLTDEILRSGSRLAYEVEVLRGETLGLAEALTEGLQDDVERFVPEGLEGSLAPRRTSHSAPGTGGANSPIARRRASLLMPKDSDVKLGEDEEGDKTRGKLEEQAADPEYISHLRTLTLVRSRLDAVVKTFGDAMSWTFPPSEVSVSSSFLSVSAPEPGSELQSIEQKGQQVSKQLRNEIADTLLGEDPIEAIGTAARRVEELKELAQVWKGTAEEKARVKFVENLAKLVEDRHRELLREGESQGRQPRGNRASESIPDIGSMQQAELAAAEGRFGGGYAFISQLQKMRGGL